MSIGQVEYEIFTFHVDIPIAPLPCTTHTQTATQHTTKTRCSSLERPYLSE
jgi:hypothetical protein